MKAWFKMFRNDWLKTVVRRESSAAWLGRVVLVAATVVIAAYTMSINPQLKGDGKEYFFQTYQFSRHFQLTGTEMDFNEFKEWLNPIFKLHVIAEKIPNYPDGCGFTRVGDRIYTHHFGFYPIMASVPAIVLRLLHLNEYKALNITNGILFIAMLWGVWMLWPYRRGVGLVYLICLLISPGVFYLDWSSTEVYLCSFITLSLVAAIGGRLKLAVLFASFASMQNQTLGLFLAILCLLFLLREMTLFRCEHRVRFHEWGLMILAGLPSLLPIGYYIINLGSPTLLGGMRFTSSSFMSLNRAWSVLMDLNQGIVVASMPVVLLSFLFGVCHLCGKKVRYVWMLGVALALCYGVSSIINWNSSCSGTMRYAAWIYCFLLTFVVANLDEVRGTKLRTCYLIALIVITAAQFAYLPGSYATLRKTARFVWTHFPSLYSPDPDVFLSRIKKCECTSFYMSPEQVWGIFVDDQGRIRKVLSTCETLLSKRDIDYRVNDKVAFEKMIANARIPPSKLRYFNFNNDEIVLNIKPFSSVDFSNPDESIGGMSGFSVPEKWGIWSTAERCAFSVNLPKAQDGCKFVLKARAYVGVEQFAVFADGRKLAEWQLAAKASGGTDYEFEVPCELTGRLIRLEFRQKELVRPNSIDKSNRDIRTLGMGFISLRMKENSK